LSSDPSGRGDRAAQDMNDFAEFQRTPPFTRLGQQATRGQCIEVRRRDRAAVAASCPKLVSSSTIISTLGASTDPQALLDGGGLRAYAEHLGLAE
jgi:hypothetical protein